MKPSSTVSLLLVAGAAYALYKFKNSLPSSDTVNPFSDNNAAYQGANWLTQLFTGDPNAVTTDVLVSKTNAYDPNAAAKVSTNVIPYDINADLIPGQVYSPPQYAPFWYTDTGAHRTVKMGKVGTVRDANGNLMQIADDAGNATYVSTSGFMGLSGYSGVTHSTIKRASTSVGTSGRTR